MTVGVGNRSEPSLIHTSVKALVAQLDSASDFESGGCRFESCRGRSFLHRSGGSDGFEPAWIEARSVCLGSSPGWWLGAVGAAQRGISSIGRVRRSQRRGTGIETRILHAFASQEPQWRNWIAHQTSNLGVVGSNPTWGALCFAQSSEAMAQWQRVGFQTQRLGVRIPLASCFPN